MARLQAACSPGREGWEPGAYLPTLKLVVSSVGQVNSRGKTMYMGTERLRHTSPSAI